MTRELVIDRDALRQKYREERDKRVQVEHRADYVFCDGDFAARYDRDVRMDQDLQFS